MGLVIKRILFYYCICLYVFHLGPVTEVIIPVDKISRQVKGYGLITYLMPEHAVKAYTELDGTIFHGRMMHLLPGKAKVNLEDGNNFKLRLFFNTFILNNF